MQTSQKGFASVSSRMKTRPITGQACIPTSRPLSVDFQTLANELYIETLRRVHQGDIGRLVSAVASYPWAGTVHDDHAAASPAERLRLWYQTRALCGDVIVEQDIHAIDVTTWFAGAHPIKAIIIGNISTRKHLDI